MCRLLHKWDGFPFLCPKSDSRRQIPVNVTWIKCHLVIHCQWFRNISYCSFGNGIKSPWRRRSSLKPRQWNSSRWFGSAWTCWMPGESLEHDTLGQVHARLINQDFFPLSSHLDFFKPGHGRMFVERRVLWRKEWKVRLARWDACVNILLYKSDKLWQPHVLSW